MKPAEIKASLVKKGISFQDIADELGCCRSQVTMCVWGNGIHNRIRLAIANKLGKPVEQVFKSHHPKPKRRVKVSTAKAA